MTPAESGAVYLDHAATTPMRRAALEAMTAALTTVGNAASLHGSGRAARRRVEESRESVAAALGARPSEVLFTGGGTESDNLAIKGLYWSRRGVDGRCRRIIAGAVEHHAVLDAVQWLVDHEGATVTWLSPDQDGRIPPEALRAALDEYGDQTALVTVMWANNEVGTVNPVARLGAVAAEFGVPMHTDAIAAAGHLPVSFGDLPGVTALSVAAHKFGGPHGIGALLLRRDAACTPLLHGGGHEREVRSGTVDVPAVVAMAAALTETERTREAEARRLGALRDRIVGHASSAIDDVIVNGPAGRQSTDRGSGTAEAAAETQGLPTIAHMTFPGCEGDSLLMLLDAAGIECSTGSACTAGVPQASHVLVAMGMDPSTARGSLRFSLGHTTTPRDVDRLLEELPAAVDRARAAGMADGRDRRGGGSAPSRGDGAAADGEGDESIEPTEELRRESVR